MYKCRNAKVDVLLINDLVNSEELKFLDECDEIKTEIIFSCDHNVPADSVENVKKQNLMRKIALKRQFQMIYGIGIGYNVLLNFLSNKKIVCSNENVVSLLGGTGVLGLKVRDLDQFIEIASNGYIDLRNYKIYYIDLYGANVHDIGAKDIALYLKEQNIIDKSDVIIKFGGS